MMIWTVTAFTIALVAYACCAAAGQADDWERAAQNKRE